MSNCNTIHSRLSLRQRLMLRLRGYVYLRHEQHLGWRGPLPIYLVQCEKYGVFQDYPHGFTGHFHCPECFEEIMKIAEKETKR